jgi:hypothetical protein
MNPETTLTKKIFAELRRRGVYVVKLHGGNMQTPGLPDLWCVWQGRLSCLEVKVPGGKPTVRQEYEINRLRAAGATAEVVRSVDEALDVFGFSFPKIA